MIGRTVTIVGAIILVLAIVVALFVVLQRYGPEAADQPERQAGEAGRSAPAVPPAAPVPDIGSGGVVTGDWYEIRFTDPKYPDNPANHHGGLDERLVALMDTATRTLDVACYDFDLANVADAMVRASQRRVRVRMVTDTDTLTNTRDPDVQAAFQQLKRANIPIVDDQRPDIMHHKFTVVDGEWVETGSWNYTDGDTYHLNNNMFIAHSLDLAANYTAEFEKMFVQRKFGPNKPRGTPDPGRVIGGSRVASYFAPEDRVAERVVDAINRQAARSIYFLAFSFTHDAIGQAMLDKAEGGVTVQGVFETTGSNTQFSEYGRMKQAGLDVYQDGNPWVMHHKVIIVDLRITVLGSFNFSNNADTGNDENLLIVDDPRIAQAYKTEYDRVLALAKNPPARKR